MNKLKLLGLALLLLSACAKDNTGTNTNNNNNNTTGCKKPATPSASSNSPVGTATSIKLYASGVSGKYQWSGPGGYISSEQNPTITNAVPGMSGTYSVTVTVGNCTSDAGTTNVTVTGGGGNPPCTIPLNTATISAPSGYFENLPLMPYCLMQGTKYEMTASDTSGKFTFIIHFKSEPTADAVYKVNETSTFTESSVFITAGYNPLSRDYHATGGTVYIKMTGGKPEVTFCDVYFDDPAFSGDHMTISAHYTCQ